MPCEFLKFPEHIVCDCDGERSEGELILSEKTYVINTELEYDLVRCGKEYGILRTVANLFNPVVKRTHTDYSFDNPADAVRAFRSVFVRGTPTSTEVEADNLLIEALKATEQ